MVSTRIHHPEGWTGVSRWTEHPPEHRRAPRPGVVPSRARMLRASRASTSLLPRLDFRLPWLDWGCKAPPRDGTVVSPHGWCPHMADVPIPGCQPCYRHCRCPLLHLGFGAAEAVFGSTSPLGAEQRNQGDSKWPVPKKPSHGGPAVPVWPDLGGAVGPRTLRAGPAGTPSRN